MNSQVLTLVLLFAVLYQLTNVSCYGTRSHIRDIFTVRTTKGYVRGKIVDQPRGKKVLSFLGIPYGKAPIGRLRFKHPLPADPWYGILNCTAYGASCYQKNFYYFKDFPGFDRLNPKTRFSEDCLTLNVFVPIPYPTTRSVMIFIHGGGFAIGGTSATLYDGQYLAATENIIVVTVNYRLASLGFLYVNHPEMDTNCGLMDQLLALKWVNQNIGYFGGDPQEVTLFGQSAGAISIGYHMVSPLTVGLFKRVILQSGSPIIDWILQTKSDSEELAVETGRNLNCFQYTNRNSLVKCLKTVHPKDLVNKEPKRKLLPFIFRPIIDQKYILEDPIEGAKTGRNFRNMDVMIGSVRDEGTLFLMLYHPLVFVPLVDRIAPYHEEFVGAIKFFLPKECGVFYKAVEQLYTDWENFNNTESTLNSSVTTINDYLFKCPQKKLSDLYSSMGNNVYSYFFPYRTPEMDFVKWLGVPHTEELRYVLGEVTTLKKYSEKDKKFAFRLMRYWANFARTGNPNISPPRTRNNGTKLIHWPKFNSNREVLILEPQSDRTFRHMDSKRCTFWENFPTLKEASRKNRCPTRL